MFVVENGEEVSSCFMQGRVMSSSTCIHQTNACMLPKFRVLASRRNEGENLLAYRRTTELADERLRSLIVDLKERGLPASRNLFEKRAL